MIVPIMFACYFLQYLDKSLLNYAAIMGILEDANLTTEQYGTLSWLFYLAFMIFEMPHAYLMQRLPLAKYLGTMVCLWGAVVACTSACNSYASLAACRFLLGIFESAVSPSLILVTSMWYKRHESPKRIGFWYVGVGCAVMAGSLISYGFQHYTGECVFDEAKLYLCSAAPVPRRFRSFPNMFILRYPLQQLADNVSVRRSCYHLLRDSRHNFPARQPYVVSTHARRESHGC